MLRTATLSALAALLAAVAVVLIPANAYALTVSRAELTDGQLRLDGMNAAPGVFVTVESTTSAAGVRSDDSGAFHVEAADFRADDCTVVVSDRRTLTDTVTLAGCTPTPVTPPATTPPPTGSCVITPGASVSVHAGDLSSYYLHTTGCDTATGPVQWEFMAGRVPVGMTGPFTQGQDAGAVSGRAMTEGLYSFMVQVRDATGDTDTETFEITVLPPRPVTISDTTLAPGTVGQSYWVGLAADGGIPGYLWTVSAGSLPPGVSLSTSGAVAGTPSAPGSYSFTVAVIDSRGAAAEQVYTLTVS
jgi:hypothetical protein